MTPSPTVSVVIPCYNLGEFLDEAVESVLAQTFQDFEILIVDDGSTNEKTRSLLTRYDRPKTRVIRTENRGLPAAKNTGLNQTTGRYVCMLDADDRLDLTYMDKSVRALDADPSIAFASHWLRTFGDEVREWTPERCDFPALLDVNTVNGAALVRRSALEAVGGFDELMRSGCEDWDIWISLVERGLPGRILPEVLFHYRRRPGSMSRIMMEADGHPKLYRYLAQKHAASFRAHLPALLARRERDLAALTIHTEDLALEHHDWTRPELDGRRDDIVVVERKLERQRRQRELEEDTARLRAEVANERSSRAVATAEALRLHAEANAARLDLDHLHHSMSWRLTRPLRTGWALIRRLAASGGTRDQ